MKRVLTLTVIVYWQVWMSLGNKISDVSNSTENAQQNLGGDASFGKRMDDIFGGLTNIEKKHKAVEKARKEFGRDSERKYMKDDPEEGNGDEATYTRQNRYSDSLARDKYGDHSHSSDYNTRRSDDRSNQRRDRSRSPDRSSRHRSGESGFRVPQGVPRRPKFVPDYKINPQNWTSYDLSDVSRDQMSERSNSAAAFDFLRQRQQQKEKDTGKEEDNSDWKNEPNKIVFKKKCSSPEANMTDSDTKFRDGKLVMPEYVVGASSKPKFSKKKPVSHSASKSDSKSSIAVSLAHLDEPGEDEDEDAEQEKEKKTVLFKKRKQRGIRKRGEDEDENE